MEDGDHSMERMDRTECVSFVSDNWTDAASTAAGVGRYLRNQTTGMAQIDVTLAKIAGLPVDTLEFPGNVWSARIHDEDRAALYAEIRAADAENRTYAASYRFRRGDGETIWLRSKGRTVVLEDGSTAVVGLCFDVTEAERRIAHSDFVVGEMKHRNSNILSLVSGLFRMTKDGAADVDTLSRAFLGRLQALSALNNSVFSSERPTAFADEIANAVLEAIRNDPRLRITSDHVALNADASQIVALSLNELMTNSVKHGALGARDGTVALDLSEDTANDLFRLTWTERGLKGVAAPSANRGFGLKVLGKLTESAHGGQPSFEWRPEGLRYTCVWPMAGLRAGVVRD